MALAIGAILALLALAVAVYPFARHRFFNRPAVDDRVPPDDPSADSPAVAGDALDAIYQSIRTLRLERELGNIPEGLYREQLNGYRLAAALLLREMDRTTDGDSDWALEEEIRVARFGLPGAGASNPRCANCGRPASPHATLCPECGETVATSTGAALPLTDEQEQS